MKADSIMRSNNNTTAEERELTHFNHFKPVTKHFKATTFTSLADFLTYNEEVQIPVLL